MNRLPRTLAVVVLAMLPLACSVQPGENANTNSNAGTNSNMNDNGDAGNANETTNENTDGESRLPAGFEDAVPVEFTEADFVFVSEAILSNDEVDIYDLGPLVLGDRLSVQCVPTFGSELDPLVVVFDNDGHRVFWNDDVNPKTTNFIAALEGNVRHDSPRYFVSVSSSLFPMTTGSYDLTIQAIRGIDAPITIGQTVVLNWAAADDVTVDEIDFGDLPEFDAANIDAAFAGQTETLQARILDVVQADFAGFDVNILTTDDDDPGGNASHVYFGEQAGTSVFARVDGIDFYNGDDMDSAIVFLNAFDGLTSNVDAMGQAIGNIVSRELGRLLGLMLSDDVTSIMDKTESADDLRTTLLDDRNFSVAELFDAPVGEQNAARLLEETVGSN